MTDEAQAVLCMCVCVCVCVCVSERERIPGDSVHVCDRNDLKRAHHMLAHTFHRTKEPCL